MSVSRKSFDIKTLNDLVTKATDVKIIVKKNNMPHIAIRNQPEYEKLLPRIEFVSASALFGNVNDYMDMYKKIHAGTHVFIENKLNIAFRYKNIFPPDFRCSHPPENLGYSDPLSGLYFYGYAYRKNFPYRNTIDLICNK